VTAVLMRRAIGGRRSAVGGRRRRQRAGMATTTM
jgi:hypothetical protein